MDKYSLRTVNVVNKAINRRIDFLKQNFPFVAGSSNNSENFKRMSETVTEFLAPIEANIGIHKKAVSPHEKEFDRDDLTYMLSEAVAPLVQKPFNDPPELADKERLTVPEFLKILESRIRQEIQQNPEDYETEETTES